jgi:hypothetical protein
MYNAHYESETQDSKWSKQMKIMFLGSVLATKWLGITAKYRVDMNHLITKPPQPRGSPGWCQRNLTKEKDNDKRKRAL